MKTSKSVLFYLVAVLFLYIYNISFSYLPGVLRTRVIICIIGGLIFLKQIVHTKSNVFSSIIGIVMLSLIPISLTILINNNFDVRFLGNSFQNILYIFGAYYIVNKTMKKNGEKMLVLDISKLIVFAIITHNFFAILMFAYDPLFDFITGIQSIDVNYSYAIGNTRLFNSRFIGMGIGSYFSGGVISCVGCILTAFIITSKTTTSRLFLWYISFVFIAITGILIARITLIGVGISFIMFILHWFDKDNLRLLIPRLVLCVFIFIISTICFSFLKNKYNDNNLFLHGFELFINLDESRLETKSTSVVIDMFIIPDDFKTILIGDGLFSNADKSFYMYTDVGYSRLLFYYGIIGLIIFFLPQLYISISIFKRTPNKEIRRLVISLGLLLVISNIKGLLDLNWLMFILYFSIYKQYDKNSSCNNEPSYRRG